MGWNTSIVNSSISFSITLLPTRNKSTCNPRMPYFSNSLSFSLEDKSKDNLSKLVFLLQFSSIVMNILFLRSTNGRSEKTNYQRNMKFLGRDLHSRQKSHRYIVNASWNSFWSFPAETNGYLEDLFDDMVHTVGKSTTVIFETVI